MTDTLAPASPETGAPALPDRWSGILCVEGVLTGDNRFIEVGAVDYSRLPVPLRFVLEDVGAHDKAVVSGRIDSADRITDPADERLQAIDFTLPEGAAVVWGEGPFDIEGEAGAEHARQVWRKFMPGVSVDLDDVDFAYKMRDDDGNLSDEFTADPGKQVDPSKVVTCTKHARLRAATGVAIPAFADANIHALVASGAFYSTSATGFIIASGANVDDWRDFNEAIVEAFAAGVLTDSPADAYASLDTADLQALASETFYDVSPVGTPGGKQNWLDKAGGLPLFIRAIAHALIRSGHPESRAIAIAVGTAKRWAKGGGNVTAKTRAKAAAAVAEWEAKKAKSHATPSKHAGGLATFAGGAPGVLTDGSAPQCHYCDNRATGYVLHAEGMAFIPFCTDHAEQATFDGEHSTPDGSADPLNIVRVGDYGIARVNPTDTGDDSLDEAILDANEQGKEVIVIEHAADPETFDAAIGGSQVIAQVGDAQLILNDGPAANGTDESAVQFCPYDGTHLDETGACPVCGWVAPQPDDLAGTLLDDNDGPSGIVIGSEDEEADEALAAESDRFPGHYDFRAVDSRKRRALAKKGHALPDGSFPIENVADLDNAIQSIGRAKKPSAAKSLIRKRAKELGAESHLPDSWSLKDRLQEVAADLVRTSNLVAGGSTEFAYNPLQWRNPENGKWIDMPTSIGNRLDALFKAMPTLSSPNGPIGQYKRAASDFDSAVQAGDYEAAKAALDRSRAAIVSFSGFVTASKDKRAAAARPKVWAAASDFIKSYQTLTDGNLLATLVENRGESGGFGPGFGKDFGDPERTAKPGGIPPTEPRSVRRGNPSIGVSEDEHPVQVLSRESHDAGTVTAGADELKNTTAARNLNEGDVIHTSHGPMVVRGVEDQGDGQTLVHTSTSMGTMSTSHVLPASEHIGTASKVKARQFPPSRIPGVSDDEYAGFLDSPITSKHIDPDTGDFTDERKALHQSVVEKYLAGIPAQDKPVQWMNGGGPASGKGGMVRLLGLPPMRETDELTGQFKPLDAEPQALLLDPDAMKVQFPEAIARIGRVQAGDASDDDREWPGQVHEESSYLAKRLHEAALDRKVHVLYDGTGDSGVGSVQKKAKKARDAGYAVEANYLTVDPEAAFPRAKQRAARTTRTVGDHVILGTYSNIPGIFAQVKDDGTFDRVRLYDNNGEGEPTLVGEGDGKSWTTHDESAYDTFQNTAEKARQMMAARTADSGTIVPNEKEASDGGQRGADGAPDGDRPGTPQPDGSGDVGEPVPAGSPVDGRGNPDGDEPGVLNLGDAIPDDYRTIALRRDLEAAGRNVPTMHEVDAATGSQAFADNMRASLEGNLYASSVEVHTPEEYAQMRLYVSEDGSAGYAINPTTGELTSVFVSPDSPHKGTAAYLAAQAGEQGATWLDGFDTVLPDIYARAGFLAKARIPFDDSQAPEGWDKSVYAKFNGGAPDVVFMQFSPREAVTYQPGQGDTVDSWDAAVAAVTPPKREPNTQVRVTSSKNPDDIESDMQGNGWNGSYPTFTRRLPGGETIRVTINSDGSVTLTRNGTTQDYPNLATALNDGRSTNAAETKPDGGYSEATADFAGITEGYAMKFDENLHWRNPRNGKFIDMPGTALKALASAFGGDDTVSSRAQRLIRNIDADIQAKHWERVNPDIQLLHRSHELEKIDETITPGAQNYQAKYDAFSHLDDVLAAAGEAADYETFHTPFLDRVDQHDDEPDEPEFDNPAPPKFDNPPGDFDEPAEPAGDDEDQPSSYERDTVIPGTDTTWGEYIDAGGSWNGGHAPTPEEVAQVIASGDDGDYAMKESQMSESITASAAPIAPPASWFANPGLVGPTPLTVTEDGRVYGHLATFDVCHLAAPAGKNVCVTAPKSGSNYSLFHLGDLITAEGTHVAVGKITLDTGHANTMASARSALAHYDNTGTVVADVHAGEDRYGIWLAGAVRSDVPEEKVKALRAAPLSGDWRRVASGKMELIAALAVNMPGFPIPRPAGLVASGVDLDGDVTDSLASLVAAGVVAHDTDGDLGILSKADMARLHRIAEQDRKIEAAVLAKQVAAVQAQAERDKVLAFAASQKGNAA